MNSRVDNPVLNVVARIQEHKTIATIHTGKLDPPERPKSPEPDELCRYNKHWKDSLTNLVYATKRELDIR
jgi:hypothetical protein